MGEIEGDWPGDGEEDAAVAGYATAGVSWVFGALDGTDTRGRVLADGTGRHGARPSRNQLFGVRRPVSRPNAVTPLTASPSLTGAERFRAWLGDRFAATAERCRRGPTGAAGVSAPAGWANAPSRRGGRPLSPL
jgi:hypothetical protein